LGKRRKNLPKSGFPGKNQDFPGKIRISREKSGFSKELDLKISIHLKALTK
jgi:hypothetical protein